jgi:hypothetical protein
LGKIDPQRSVRIAKDGLQIFDEELARNPHDRVLRSGRARAIRYLAHAYQRNRDPDKARAAIQEGIAAEEQLVKESPADKRELHELITSRRVLESF